MGAAAGLRGQRRGQHTGWRQRAAAREAVGRQLGRQQRLACDGRCEGVQGAGLRQVVQPRPALKPGRRGRAVRPPAGAAQKGSPRGKRSCFGPMTATSCLMNSASSAVYAPPPAAPAREASHASFAAAPQRWAARVAAAMSSAAAAATCSGGSWPSGAAFPRAGTADPPLQTACDGDLCTD
jgi:hypothetical protein